jgi:hypothetical protein
MIIYISLLKVNNINYMPKYILKKEEDICNNELYVKKKIFINKNKRYCIHKYINQETGLKIYKIKRKKS